MITENNWQNGNKNRNSNLRNFTKKRMIKVNFLLIMILKKSL